VTLSNGSAGLHGDRSATTPPAPQPPALSAGGANRETLIAELVEEMTSWKPRERMHAFRSWLKGSLSLIHLHVLTILEADGPLQMSHLAETLDVSVASATGIIGRMEERGLVERHHDELDRRVVIVRPTAAGVAVFRDMAAERRRHLTDMLARLTDEELAALLIGLRAIRAARVAHPADHDAVIAATVAVGAAETSSDTGPAGSTAPAEERPRS
jgi:DNA-binding MarR family transcriptional regulator